MAKSKELEVKTKNDALSQKIGSLKQNAFALIQEVRELGNLSYLDLTRGIDLFEEVRRFEMKLIRQALEETDGRQVTTVRMLGLKKTTLNKKIKRYGIDPHEKSEFKRSKNGVTAKYLFLPATKRRKKIKS